MKSAWFYEFKKYLANTNETKLKEEWAEIEKMNYKGPKAYEYVAYYCKYYSAKRVMTRGQGKGSVSV